MNPQGSDGMGLVRLAVTSVLNNCRNGFWRGACAFTLLITAFTHAKADPRIDPGTATTQAQQRASLQKGPDGVIQQAGLASWYGRHWRGRKTASGMIFDERQLTAASLVLPLATRARVTNMQNGKSVDVLVNDRGPYMGNRVMDLSERAAALLGITKSGLGQVVIRAHLAQGMSAAGAG
ncbi:MAG: septal ring lytic transglycosylase RlpA family protein [Alphaproteobacteria bacterium]|nr:septal ring lytic transglycosylase RlpA family protein [Alphaproteobacteria bacterium]MBV9016981.1 septal ring lytic transglycosylase RlpA family protein [Alphaproteobacteria bacterium]MBV9585381.1 septal ring lytic transglycosylase RlpA family protein [Alphaproteobacteria bacterium]MBV9967072.1 septal ring lytic transglycosylase RlpA family protein [Alphaproteobacteria bacterium]